MTADGTADPEMHIAAPNRPLDQEVMDRLRQALESCPDVAFAHLVQVWVPEHHPQPDNTLFVWLVPGALRSLRGALNLLSRIVAGVLPEDVYLDVVVLNSAPELLNQVEAAGCLLVERDPQERERALAAAAAPDPIEPNRARSNLWWWWPF